MKCEKLKKIVRNTGGTTLYTQHYIDGIEYKDAGIEAIYHDEGRFYNVSGEDFQRLQSSYPGKIGFTIGLGNNSIYRYDKSGVWNTNLTIGKFTKLPDYD
ncbi:MAG: hypothetical protein IPL92_12290 [Saprospiraceae bacterium]|nr:hypothetical protein [Candidatus Opimibacter iunctus]